MVSRFSSDTGSPGSPKNPVRDRAVDRLILAGKSAYPSDVVPAMAKHLLPEDLADHREILRQAHARAPGLFSQWVNQLSRETMLSHETRLEKLSIFVERVLTDDADRSAALLRTAFALAPQHTDEVHPFVERLLAWGVTLHTVSLEHHGRSLFMALCLTDRAPQTIQWLLDVKDGAAHLQQQDETGATVLDWAARSNHPATALQLVRAGADPHRKGPDQWSPCERLETFSRGLAASLSQARLDWLERAAHQRAARVAPSPRGTWRQRARP